MNKDKYIMYNGLHSPHLLNAEIIRKFVKDNSIAMLYCPDNLSSFTRLERTWLMDLLSTLEIEGWEEFATKTHVKYMYKIAQREEYLEEVNMDNRIWMNTILKAESALYDKRYGNGSRSVET